MTSRNDIEIFYFFRPTTHNSIMLFEFQWYPKENNKKIHAYKHIVAHKNTFELFDFCRRMRVEKSWTYVFRWYYIWIYVIRCSVCASAYGRGFGQWRWVFLYPACVLILLNRFSPQEYVSRKCCTRIHHVIRKMCYHL